MGKSDEPNTEGRKDRAAQPLGERRGVTSHEDTMKTGKRETKTAGPDGPDATYVGDTFKKQPH